MYHTIQYNTVTNIVNYNAIEQLNADSCPNTQNIPELGKQKVQEYPGNSSVQWELNNCIISQWPFVKYYFVLQVQYYVILYCTIWYGTILCYTVLYCMVWYNIMLYLTIKFPSFLFSTGTSELCDK